MARNANQYEHAGRIINIWEMKIDVEAKEHGMLI
jgi:hypothetical protein